MYGQFIHCFGRFQIAFPGAPIQIPDLVLLILSFLSQWEAETSLDMLAQASSTES